MTALNFHKRFALIVERGEKLQTIRKLRKDGTFPCTVGGAIQLYTGMRSKNCRKLGDAVCTMAREIVIKANGTVKISGVCLHHLSVDDLARADGFKNSSEMCGWIGSIYGYPFRGQVIEWSLVKGAGE
ncbi:MAG: hypothetical protein COA65_08995 [Rhodospirillaceae bacterium]|nr:MAG: hypothetical protein COA65_08995 [Rhodospirillaceae bacterium]